MSYAQKSRLIAGLAILFGALSCAFGDQVNPDIEFRVIQNDSCEKCSRVNFKNVFTGNEVRIHAEPDFLLNGDSISQVEMIRFDNRIEGRIEWTAEIRMDLEIRQRSADYRKKSVSARELLLASVKGQPIEVIVIGELIDGMLLGSFDSPAELRSVFPGAVNKGKTEVLEGSPEFTRLTQRFKAARARDNSDSEVIDELLDAIDAGDEEALEKLQSELFR